MDATLSAMDLPRTKPKRKRLGLVLGVTAAVAAVALISVALSKLGTAAPSVKREGLWLGTVTRGELVREVRGPGTLVPEQIRFVSAAWSSRVEAIRVKAGE